MDDIKVSVVCLAYNHERYIRDALEGFVNQKTNFKYEVLINDDCSTDNTAKIIREYEEKYPEIIKPIYQQENQYSQDISIWNTHILPRVKGKYIAVCEGDDCWINESKLQIQYDYMNQHEDCYLCVHSYVINNISNGTSTEVVRSNIDRDFTLDEIVQGGGGLFATASLFMRNEVKKNLPKEFIVSSFGDYQIPVFACLLGKVHYINKTMSKYNSMAIGSWSTRNKYDISVTLRIYNDIIIFLTNANSYSGFKYNEIFTNEINKNQLFIMYAKDQFRELKKNNYYKTHKQVFSSKQRTIINIGSISKSLVRIVRKIKHKISR